jgi:hypothetical protein
MRGRPTNNRRGPNPLTRSYESNGPDVKIRGNAHHVAEKYLQLARDAHTGGDPVAAENYLQHAEHYFRLIAAAQAAQMHAQSGGQPPAEGEVFDFDDDDDFGGVADRFASPSERAPVPYAPAPQPYLSQPAAPAAGQPPYPERPAAEGERQGQADRGGYQVRQDRQDRQGVRHPDRGPRPDRPYADRQEGQRDNRAPRDGRPRDFRPYREGQPPRGAPGAPDSPETPATALPSFITAAPRVVAPPETDEPQPPFVDNGVEPEAPANETGAPFDEAQNDGRFPGRGRRRRLRSPYGFRVAAGQDDEAPDEASLPPVDPPPIPE